MWWITDSYSAGMKKKENLNQQLPLSWEKLKL